MPFKWSTSLHPEDPPISMGPKTDLKSFGEEKKSLRLAGNRTIMSWLNGIKGNLNTGKLPSVY
jgi:hypothetical protein